MSILQVVKNRLNEDAKVWHKLWSIRFLLLAGFFGTLSEIYSKLPSDWVNALPENFKATLGVIGLFFGGCSGIARVLKQAGIGDDK